ncbi:hypothetical protein GF391_00130 [Candidatus Uhrbacteria bacterium]|nr:hypothetical protein [Candidatus Uhrbacteria bacterium]
MDRQDALLMLQRFVIELTLAGVESKEDYRKWAKGNDELMCELFDYVPEAGMPKVAYLVSPHFHPGLPLVGLNYTPVAHNLLYRYVQGWTTQLRMCRGIVFDRDAELVALCLPKFFNAAENAETKVLPARPVEVLEKMDGHCGLHFFYDGDFHVKTRGSFTHRTAEIAGELMRSLVAEYEWKSAGIEHLSIITEVIHPETRVICKYRGSRLVLIAAYDNRTLEDFTHAKLSALGKRLGVQTVKRRSFQTTEAVRKATRDPNMSNREGFVVRFADNRRVKFKNQKYLEQMVARKLSYSYLMLRWMDGRLEAILKTLPEEVIPQANMMVEYLKKARRMRRAIKLQRQYLYELVPPDKSTPYYRKVCRDFLRH